MTPARLEIIERVEPEAVPSEAEPGFIAGTRLPLEQGHPGKMARRQARPTKNSPHRILVSEAEMLAVGRVHAGMEHHLDSGGLRNVR